MTTKINVEVFFEKEVWLFFVLRLKNYSIFFNLKIIILLDFNRDVSHKRLI